MRIVLEKNVGTGVTEPLLYGRKVHLRRRHHGGYPMPEKTPSNVRQAKPVRGRLDMPGEEILVPDGTVLSDCALLNTVRENPVLILFPLCSLSRSSRWTSALRQTDRTVIGSASIAG